MRDSVSVKLRWALSSGTPGCLPPSASACSPAANGLGFQRRHGFPYLLQPTLSKGQLRATHLHACLCRTAGLPHHPLPGPGNNSATSAANWRLVTHRLMLRCVGLDLRAVQRHVPQLTSPACWHNASTCTNRPDSAAVHILLAKVGDGPKSGVLFAANTLKAMSSWRRWAMRREDATPTQ